MEYLRTKRNRRAGRFRHRVVRVLDRIFNDWFRGYGYQPLRALIPLAVLVIAIAAPLLPASSSQAMRTADPSGVVYTPQGPLTEIEAGHHPTAPCGNGKVRCFNPWLYAIDTVIPVVDLKQRSTWSPTTDTTAGQLLQAATNTATLLGWALSSLLVLGLAQSTTRPQD